MSGSAIADGFVTVFTNASAFGAGNVGKNYKALDTAGCNIVVWPRYRETRPHAYGRGGPREKDYTFFLDMWLTDTGDAANDFNRWLSFEDLVELELQANETVNSTVDFMGDVRMERQRDVTYEYGGQQWYRTLCEVDVRQVNE